MKDPVQVQPPSSNCLTVIQSFSGVPQVQPTLLPTHIVLTFWLAWVWVQFTSLFCTSQPLGNQPSPWAQFQLQDTFTMLFCKLHWAHPHLLPVKNPNIWSTYCWVWWPCCSCGQTGKEWADMNPSPKERDMEFVCMDKSCCNIVKWCLEAWSIVFSSG